MYGIKVTANKACNQVGNPAIRIGKFAILQIKATANGRPRRGLLPVCVVAEACRRQHDGETTDDRRRADPVASVGLERRACSCDPPLDACPYRLASPWRKSGINASPTVIHVSPATTEGQR